MSPLFASLSLEQLSNIAHAPALLVPEFLLFCSGAEFKVILQPKYPASLHLSLQIPDPNSSHRERRGYNLKLLRVVSGLLSGSGFACEVHDPNKTDANPDYSRWHVTLDASLSQKHAVDGFCKYQYIGCCMYLPSKINPFFYKLCSHKSR